MASETDSVTEEQGKLPTPPLPSSHPSEASHADETSPTMAAGESHPCSHELYEEAAVLMTHKLDKDKLSVTASTSTSTSRSREMRLNPPGELHELHLQQEVSEPELQQQQQLALEIGTVQKAQISKSDSTVVLSAKTHNRCASPNNYQVAQQPDDETNSLCRTGYTAEEEMHEEADVNTAHKARHRWLRKTKEDHKTEQPTPTRVSRLEANESDDEHNCPAIASTTESPPSEARHRWLRKKKGDHKNEQPTPTRVSRLEANESDDEHIYPAIASTTESPLFQASHNKAPLFVDKTSRWTDSHGKSVWETEDGVDSALLEVFQSEADDLKHNGIIWNRENEQRQIASCGVSSCEWMIEKIFDATTCTWYIRVGEAPHSNHLETNTDTYNIPDEQSEKQQRRCDFDVEVDEAPVQNEPVPATDDLPHEELAHDQPGAFHVYPSGNGEDENTTIEEPYFCRHEESPREHSNGIIVEAALVIEEEEPSERLLIEAEPVDHDDAKRIDDANRTIVRLKVTLFVLVSSAVLLALIVGLSVGLTSRTDALPPPSPTDATTALPTMAPTIEWRQAFWESLPKETKAVIRSGFSSSSKAPPSYVTATNKTINRHPQSSRNLPQYEAFQWVTEMDELHLTLSQEEILPRMTQRFALATLFYATEGLGWKVHTNWLDPSQEECRWSECSCDGRDDMCDSLKLDLNDLSNTLPNELILLSTSLTMLAIDFNDLLGGAIPVALGGLLKLNTLLLSGNKLSGTIPTQLGNLINLVELDLGGNGKLMGQIPSELGRLSMLTHLDLHANALTGTIPSELGSLQNLESLVLYGNNLDGTVPVEVCNLLANNRNTTVLTVDCNDLIHCNDSCHCTCAN